MQFIRWNPAVIHVGAALCGLTMISVSDTTPSVLPPTIVKSQPPPRVTPLKIPGTHNVFRLSAKLISGSQPEGEAAFKALKALGVKTIITVDGARPDVKTARKYGLRYVQIPFGYSNLPREQAVFIARAVRDLPGPIYLHCHHGQHRGPVAAACAMIALEGWNRAESLAFLKRAGTGTNYRGLWDSVRQFRAPSAEELKKAPHQYHSIAPTAPLMQTMVKLDELHDSLKAAQNAKWRARADHPDSDAPHEALMLREIYSELLRDNNTAKRPADFRAWLSQGETAAVELEAALRAGDNRKADVAQKKVTATCNSCHVVYRNVPQNSTRR